MTASVLLVNLPLADVSTTPFFVMPPGLLSLAAYLREKGETVDCIDLNVFPKNKNPREAAQALEDLLQDRRPTLAGVSVMAAGQFPRARRICQQIRRAVPQARTAVGGAHVSQFPREILENCPEIDFVVLGEGEEQAYACAQYARTGKSPSVWPDGIAYRDSDGAITVLPKTRYIADLDRLPWPAYDLVNFEDYRHDTRTWHNPFQVDLSLRVPIITSRGCPNLCNFCSVARCMGQGYRPLSAGRLVDLMQMLYEERGVRYFAIFDANFAQDVDRVLAICHELTRRNLDIVLDLPTGLPINATAKVMVDALAQAGLIRTCISVETGDDFIRNDVMYKGVDHDEIFEVVAAIRQHPQIFLLTDYVIGMPEDTAESLEASCRLIEALDTDDITLSLATPYPGTKLFEQCRRDKLFLPDIDCDHLHEADWYSHVNLNRFCIKPYHVDLDTLSEYRSRILALRKVKMAGYMQRMKTHFGVAPESMREDYGATVSSEARADHGRRISQSAGASGYRPNAEVA